MSKEIGQGKVILPLWHGVSRDDILQFSPPLADKMALDTSKLSLNQIALKILEVVRPEIHQNLLRILALEKLIKDAEVKEVSVSELSLGPIRHKIMSEKLLIRIKIVHHIFSDVMGGSLEHNINLFRRDARPQEEVAHWEKMAAVYLDATRGANISLEQRKEILQVLLAVSTKSLTDERVQKLKH